MRLEFHQLDRRWKHLRVRHPARQRQLLASLAEVGQQTPIVVVAVEGQPGRHLVYRFTKVCSYLFVFLICLVAWQENPKGPSWY